MSNVTPIISDKIQASIKYPSRRTIAPTGIDKNRIARHHAVSVVIFCLIVAIQFDLELGHMD